MHKGLGNLECYKEGRKLRNYISQISKKFPSFERYLLHSQITGSSRSITNNIAEGYGRFTYKDTRSFFVIARGSTVETMDHLIIALDESYIINSEMKKGIELCEKVQKLINGYINYLDKSNNPSP